MYKTLNHWPPAEDMKGYLKYLVSFGLCASGTLPETAPASADRRWLDKKNVKLWLILNLEWILNESRVQFGFLWVIWNQDPALSFGLAINTPYQPVQGSVCDSSRKVSLDDKSGDVGLGGDWLEYAWRRVSVHKYSVLHKHYSTSFVPHVTNGYKWTCLKSLFQKH